MKAEAGSRVEITNGNPPCDDGRVGVVVGKVRERITSGRKRKLITRYIVQFHKPLDWSYFRRKEFKVLGEGGK